MPDGDADAFFKDAERICSCRPFSYAHAAIVGMVCCLVAAYLAMCWVKGVFPLMPFSSFVYNQEMGAHKGIKMADTNSEYATQAMVASNLNFHIGDTLAIAANFASNLISADSNSFHEAMATTLSAANDDGRNAVPR